MTVADLLAEIDSEGWEIGVHPTWNSFDNGEEMLHQKQSVETQIPGEVGSVRQHHLHWDPRITPEAHENVGLIHDSSAQVGGNIGFRFGTSYPWKLYDQEQEQTEVLEIPIAVSGATLLKPWNMNLTVTESKKYIARLAEKVKEVGGVFGLHFHPLRIINDKRYFKLYEYTLKYLSENGAWFAPAAEIAQWWKQNNSSIRVH